MGQQSTDKNYYELLGVKRTATTKEIKEAYREISRVYHPDSNFYDEIIDDVPSDTGMDMYKLITAAYNTLIHDQKRAQYNDTLPPPLNEWDEGEKKFGDGHFHAPRRTAHSMGTFGNMQRSQFDDLDEETLQRVRPMSEVITLKRGFWFRVKRFFNL